jgi:hypothetical protein
MFYGTGIGDVPALFWWGNLSEKDHFEDLGVKAGKY